MRSLGVELVGVGELAPHVPNVVIGLVHTLFLTFDHDPSPSQPRCSVNTCVNWALRGTQVSVEPHPNHLSASHHDPSTTATNEELRAEGFVLMRWRVDGHTAPTFFASRLLSRPPSMATPSCNRTISLAAMQYIPVLSTPPLADPPIKMYLQPSLHAAAVAAVRINNVNPPSACENCSLLALTWALRGIQVILSVNRLCSRTIRTHTSRSNDEYYGLPRSSPAVAICTCHANPTPIASSTFAADLLIQHYSFQPNQLPLHWVNLQHEATRN
ncbi:hypothetical protein BD410DRAFT_801993 [Rickenella mellea]|uniref:Uncharacterized protein n=1 Tax=Rickenella mellea TaxID=50990 RepID=A0A4Y7QCV6_9AGAM|nr:hypothetical protein BD410DRAFT_801993 [Rickenella mellea]